MNIISRAAWGAEAPTSRIATTWGRRTEFVVHHSETPTTATVKSIQAFHMGPQRGWSDIGYSFLVDDQGRIYEGRGWLIVGAHAKDHNTSGIGVCYLGYNAPTAAAKRSIRELYDYACEKAGHKLLIRGHGQLSGNSTDCPGSTLLAWVKAGMPVPAEPTPTGYTRLIQLKDPPMHGDDVTWVQRRLNAHGAEVTVDGAYGPRTTAETRAFQRDHGLVDDGRVGPKTWTALAVPVT